jgi:hypothetical protein
MTASFISELLTRYGVEGGVLGVLVWMFMTQTKKSEKRIVKNKTRVLADLTTCIKAIKETLDRLERKSQQ